MKIEEEIELANALLEILKNANSTKASVYLEKAIDDLAKAVKFG